MKKMITLIMVLAICFSFCSCNIGENTNTEGKETSVEKIYAGTYVCERTSWVPIQNVKQYGEMKDVAPITQKTLYLNQDGTGSATNAVIKSDILGQVPVGAIESVEINLTWHVEDGKIITESQTQYLMNLLTGEQETNNEPYPAKTTVYIIDGTSIYIEGYSHLVYRKQS